MHNEPLFIGRWRAVLKLSSAAAILCALAVPATSQPVASQSLTPTLLPSSTSMTSAEQSLLDAINDYRRGQGRAAWAAEPALAAVARAHSQAMAQRGRFSHDGFKHRAESTGSALCVENLLQGTVSSASAVRLWTASGEHRDNLLEPGARFAGIGMAGRFATMLACASSPATPVNADAAPLHGGTR